MKWDKIKWSEEKWNRKEFNWIIRIMFRTAESEMTIISTNCSKIYGIKPVIISMGLLLFLSDIIL